MACPMAAINGFPGRPELRTWKVHCIGSKVLFLVRAIKVRRRQPNMSQKKFLRRRTFLLRLANRRVRDGRTLFRERPISEAIS